MPKIAGKYQAIVREKRIVRTVDAESKEHAIRTVLLDLSKDEDRMDFEAWVLGGMEIELLIG